MPRRSTERICGQEAVEESRSIVIFSLGVVLIILDALVYGFIVPVVGIYIAKHLTILLQASPLAEIILIIFSVFGILFCAFNLRTEISFLKHFFIHDRGYNSVLKMRDLVNVGVLVLSIYWLYDSVRLMAEDKAMKKENLSEAIGYLLLKQVGLEDWIEECSCTLQRSFTYYPQISAIDQNEFSIKNCYNNLVQWVYSLFYDTELETFGPVLCEKCLVKDQLLHAAQFIFSIALITASVTKILYFNTLYTYLRTMDIFVSMMDSIENAEPEDDSCPEPDQDIDDEEGNSKEKSFTRSLNTSQVAFKSNLPTSSPNLRKAMGRNFNL